jgi:hypothetical protein
VAQPHRLDARGAAGLDVTAPVADHPRCGTVDAKFPACEVEGMRVGLERLVFAGDQRRNLQRVPRDDHVQALPAVAGDEGGRDAMLVEPFEQFPAAGVQRRILRRVLFVAEQCGFRDGPLGRAHFAERFEDGAVAYPHFGLDAREVEHGLGERSVHVEEDRLGQAEQRWRFRIVHAQAAV